jgi:hypothetical protein
MNEVDPQAPHGEIPTGLAHIDMIARFNQRNRALAQSLLQSHRDDLALLGRALHVLYLAATCHRKCWGGGHVMEFMAGRVYNLACAAYSLICNAYYDEALNLTRSIGEAANLVALFHMDEHAFGKWVKAAKAERIKKFGPAKVRKRLKAEGGVLLMDDDQYAELCESYTHPTPGAAPNQHNEMQRAVCGGIVQEEGLCESLRALIDMVGAIALYYAKLFQFDDLFEQMTRQLRGDQPVGENATDAPPESPAG